jgi:hypothetical protein
MLLNNNLVNNENEIKEKEKSNVTTQVTNIDVPEFNPFIYDRIYNPLYYPYAYPAYPYNNYTYDIRPFPRQYPGRIYDYNGHNRKHNIENKISHTSSINKHDGRKRK